MRWQSKALLAGLAGAATYSIYRAVESPESRLFGPVFSRGTCGNQQLALTFDDGPDPVWTPRLAAVLRRFNIRATFFCIGQRVEVYPDIVRSLIDDGHEIGNHSHSHRNLWYRSRTQVRSEIERCQAALSALTANVPALFRPPFGDRGPQVLSEARKLNLSTVLWSLDTRDWNSPTAETIFHDVRNRARDGDVLLFHDGSHDNRFTDRTSTLTAVTELAQWSIERQYQFVTVSALMESYKGNR
jgi:peptidoglycan/xylan/chitin deacetylase (PgdA/CDA1 family)